VTVADIPETGRHFKLVADAPTRAAIAKLAGIVALPRLQANLDVTRHGNGGLRVVGRVSATVVQACVVTLEPLDNELSESVDVVFLPAAEVAGGAGGRDGADAEDGPESMTDGTVDLGAVATEFLILGIDPYPRKPGAVFEAPEGGAGEDKARPFAALAALQKKERGPAR
jgi:uncharacterized metal-binding protein YceD (DUF177 family)